MKKIVVAWTVCILGLLGLFAWLGGSAVQPPKEEQPPVIQGEFSLQGAEGKLVTNKDFKGKYLLVYFGFTHCPDICPTSLLLMNNAIDHLGASAKKVQPLFITIDPERDTPAIVTEYVKHFGDRVVGLSGTPEQIKTVADHYKVYYSKVEDKDSAMGYVMDHSGFIYLIGPDGRYIAHFPHNVSEQALQDGLAKNIQ